MKIFFGTLLLSAALLLLPLRGWCQRQELQQLLLNVEKLTQLKGLLADMKSGYDIYRQGYGTVSALSKGNFELHDTYLGSLLRVSLPVRQYTRVAEILSKQASLSGEYRQAFSRFSRSGHFTPAELGYLGKVYGNLLRESLDGLEELANVTLPGKLRMSDAERIEAIDRIYEQSARQLSFLRHFNQQGFLMEQRRAREAGDVQHMQQIFSIHP